MGLQLVCSNFSQDVLTPHLWLAGEFRPAALSLGIVLCLFVGIGVPWNLIVICIIVKKRLFKQPAILLLFNLAVTDFLFCAVVMPINLVTAIAGEFIFGSSDYARCQACQMAGIVLDVVLLMSVYSIALLSLDRFLYVRKPLDYESIVTLKRVIAILVVCWCVFV